jgi:two-component system sensor histidine kinase EvgS
MNGVLIKPLSLGALENELMRYFDSSPIELGEEYSFDAFANLIQDNPKKIIVILEEIERVHLEILNQLRSDGNKNSIDEAQFQSLVHKVKGGAQLLQASQFINICIQLEASGPLLERNNRFIQLLEEQNQIIETYKERYRRKP